MSRITVLPSQTQFDAESGETILASAIRQGHNLPHACQSGVCGSCRARLLSGKVSHSGCYDDYVLTDAERESGMVLLCCSEAEGDVELDMPGYAGSRAISVRTLPARVGSIDVRGDVAVMEVVLPKAPAFKFYAGQYMDILLKDGSRSYSIANAPSQNDKLEFHIRHRQGGLFSPLLFDGRLESGSIIRLRGPLGGFTLNENSSKPLVLMATGTGFAPIKSFLAHLAETDPNREIHIYHGSRTEAGLYDRESLSVLLQQFSNARYIPVLSRPNGQWQGAKGYVQQQVLADIPDLSSYEVYACGSLQMTEDARRLFAEQGRLPENAFFSDAFTVSA